MLTNLGTLTALNDLNTKTTESILVTEGINDKNLSNLVTFKKIYNEETKSFDFGLYDSFNNIIARIKNNDYLDYNFKPFDFRVGELQDSSLGNLESFDNLPEIGNLYFKELDLDNLRYMETFYQDSIKYFYCNSIPRLNMNLRVLPFLNYSNDCINFVKNYNTINNIDCLKPFTDIFIIAEKENNGIKERKVIKNTIKNKFKNIINKDAEFSLSTFNQFDTSVQRFTKFEGSKTIKESIIVKTKNQYTMVSILDYASLENRIIKYNTFIYDNYIDINNNTIIYSSTSYERFFDFEIEESIITLIGLNIRPKSDSLDALELIKKVIPINDIKNAKVYSYNTFKKDDNYVNNIFSNNITFDITNTINTMSLNNIKDINFKTNKNINDDTISTDLIQIYFNNNIGYHEVQYLIAEDNYFSLKTFFNYNNTKLNAVYQYEELKIQYMNLDDNNVFVTIFPNEVLSDKGISNYPRIDHFYTIRNNLNISFDRTTYDLDINMPGIPLKEFDIITNISFNVIPLYNSDNSEDFEDSGDYENKNNICLDIIYTSNNSSLVKHELIVLGYTELSSFNDIKELYDPFYKITKKVVFVKFQDNYIIREDLISKKYTPSLNMFKGSYNNLIKFADFLVPSVDTNINNISIDIQKGWLGVNIEDLIQEGYTIKYILEAPNFIFKHSHDYGDNLYDLTTQDYKLPVQYNFDIEQKEIVPDTITNYKQMYLNCHFYFTNTNVNNKLNDKINCSLIGNIKNKYNFMDVFFELQTYNMIVPEWSTSEVDDSIIINEISLDNFVLEN